jgi:hypothetical protein
MLPTSASRYEDIALRSWRKWGEAWGGESILAVASVSHAFSGSRRPAIGAVFDDDEGSRKVSEWFKEPILKTASDLRSVRLSCKLFCLSSKQP